MIAEIVDENGRLLPLGEEGELIITTIGMEAMPLIRYRTGDYTRIFPTCCPCGSEVMRLDSVRRKGETSAIRELDEILFALPWVVDYRAEKKDGRLQLDVLTCGEGNLPDWDADWTLRTVTDGDYALYGGKRVLL